jgi:hypothetical protein
MNSWKKPTLGLNVVLLLNDADSHTRRWRLVQMHDDKDDENDEDDYDFDLCVASH